MCVHNYVSACEGGGEDDYIGTTCSHVLGKGVNQVSQKKMGHSTSFRYENTSWCGLTEDIDSSQTTTRQETLTANSAPKSMYL